MSNAKAGDNTEGPYIYECCDRCREKIMEEQHTFDEFGYFHVPCHKYQPTKVTLCPDLKPLPPSSSAQKRALFLVGGQRKSNREDF